MINQCDLQTYDSYPQNIEKKCGTTILKYIVMSYNTIHVVSLLVFTTVLGWYTNLVHIEIAIHMYVELL